VHRHDHHNHESILIMGVDADPDEICHMVEELLSVFFVNVHIPFTSCPSSSKSSVINSKGSINP
jgi:hypothetical protein